MTREESLLETNPRDVRGPTLTQCQTPDAGLREGWAETGGTREGSVIDVRVSVDAREGRTGVETGEDQ